MFIYGYNLNRHANIVRAGVIPFTVKDYKLYFLLGIDRRTRELTDFGGGVKSTESMIDAAHRELSEESCEFFGDTISKQDVNCSLAITNNTQNTAIFFLRVDSKWLFNAEREFSKCQKRLGAIKKHTELIGVKWIQEHDFKVIAFNRRNQCMWKRIQNIFYCNTTWVELRIILLLGNELNMLLKLWQFCGHNLPPETSLQQYIFNFAFVIAKFVNIQESIN